MDGQIAAACFCEMWLFAEGQYHSKEVRVDIIFAQDFAKEVRRYLERVDGSFRVDGAEEKSQSTFAQQLIANDLHYSHAGSIWRIIVDRRP